MITKMNFAYWTYLVKLQTFTALRKLMPVFGHKAPWTRVLTWLMTACLKITCIICWATNCNQRKTKACRETTCWMY